MPVEVLIREAAPEDAAFLARLLVEVHDIHVAALPHVFRAIAADEQTTAFLREQIGDKDGQAFVAERAGAPVGYAWVRLHEAPPDPRLVPRRWVEVDTLVVVAAVRRSGVGRALMGRAHRWAAERGVTEVQVVVWGFNEGAIRFYEGLGYATARRTMRRPLVGRGEGRPDE